jgi:hypothetical protein
VVWLHSFSEASQGIWFHYYALIPKEKRNKIDARSHKCILLGYSNTTKAYHIYNEVNKKFILPIYLIFLESSKNENIIERKLDHLDKSTRINTYHEFDEIPHIEEGTHILDKSMESPFEAPSPPHEEVSTTS